MPGMINVGGAHIHPPEILPQDIQKFLDEATDGVIIFSLGSIIQSKDMPPGKLKTFANVFKNLKQRVLMKYEDTNLRVSSNVMITKWLPQSDVLAHKNVVLFITHGGIFGTQEALYRGVPMLFIPFYGDQHRNALRAERDGYALTIPFNQLSTSILKEKLNELLTDTKYKERVKQVSIIFRDNPIPVMDEAMYWIEYVIRNQGAKHLKSAGIHLPWYKHALLDIIFWFSLFISIIIVLIIKILKVLHSRYIKGLNTNDKPKAD